MTILTAGSHMSVADKRLTASPFTDTLDGSILLACDCSINRRLSTGGSAGAAISVARLTCRRRRRSATVSSPSCLWTEGAP